MTSKAESPDKYIASLPEERKKVVSALRKTIKENLPSGFQETMQYGMISFVVPLSVYPSGYLGNPKVPLPFISIASQKQYVSLYHMGIYADKKLLEWFNKAYQSKMKKKIDMGKSCFRFKKPEDMPPDLIGALAKKISVKEWIASYERGK